ncbi:MAG TPA: hypothetical protein VFT30_04905 [Nitrospira sp.]|nr:hypothetical protein [Nitrospira sp.]
MTGTEARGATQLPLSSMKRLDCGSAPGPKALKEGVKDPARHVVSLNSSDGLIMLYGHPVVSKIALQALVERALTGHPVVYLDGTHTFDALLIGQLARSRRQQPRKALAMIHVARAFSTRQLERLMSHCLAGALERYQASTAVISGLLESISADCMTDKEVNRLTDRMIESMRHLIQQGFLLLCPCPSVPMPMAPAYRLFGLLRSMSHRCIRVYEVHGKVVTKEISFDAIPIHTESFEDIRVDSSLPFQSTDQCAFSAR